MVIIINHPSHIRKFGIVLALSGYVIEKKTILRQCRCNIDPVLTGFCQLQSTVGYTSAKYYGSIYILFYKIWGWRAHIAVPWFFGSFYLPCSGPPVCCCALCLCSPGASHLLSSTLTLGSLSCRSEEEADESEERIQPPPPGLRDGDEGEEELELELDPKRSRELDWRALAWSGLAEALDMMIDEATGSFFCLSIKMLP